MMDTMKGAMDTTRKIEMSGEKTLEEVFEILKSDAGVTAIAKPELKKGLFGKTIAFPKQNRTTPSLTVKGSTATLTRKQDTSSGSGFSVGGVGIPRGGNKMSEMELGNEYFKNLAEAIANALK